MSEIPLSCSCGRFKAVLRDCDASSGRRLKCYCTDCQTAAHAFGGGEILDAHGGTDLFHTTPSKLEITDGEEHLACLRLSPDGLMRWYASCCDTPVFSTLASPKLRFIGISSKVVDGDLEATLGPIKTIAKTKDAKPGADGPTDSRYIGAVWGVLSRHMGAVITGKKHNPLFDDDATPVVEPRVLTKEQRKSFTPEY
ncbi:DUF6151 family protein [Shimia thalassica]|uniref:DUF6151 family protein n=1 Tax=Shimia thalassica TaxID=1715693 RepID=UPI0026E443CC|nr:DUF6151 family protein [Shimia thalassica]MDO6798098.1 DUF6151 family protein [Shimia thalassica]